MRKHIGSVLLELRGVASRDLQRRKKNLRANERGGGGVGGQELVVMERTLLIFLGLRGAAICCFC